MKERNAQRIFNYIKATVYQQNVTMDEKREEDRGREEKKESLLDNHFISITPN